MARFFINISDAIFSVTKTVTEVESGNIYCYDIKTTPGNSIDITITGDYSKPYYVLDGGSSTLIVGGLATVIANDSLVVCFYLSSSQLTSEYNTAAIEIEDTTLVSGYRVYNDEVTNFLDDPVVVIAAPIGVFEVGPINIVASVTYQVITTFTTITDISIYDSSGNDVTETFALSISGGNVDIDSTNNVNDLTVKIIGE